MNPTFDYTIAETWLRNGRANPACLSYHEKQVGGLSTPSKMPWYGWSISATKCKTGSALRDVPNSVCSKCYALRGRYVFGKVQNALERRFYMWESNPSKWAAHMVLLLEGKAKGKTKEFRWFDSGDVQGIDMIHSIVWIANKLPHIRFWLPTKEYKLFKRLDVMKLIVTADNLTVRVSAPQFGETISLHGYATSSVGAGEGTPCKAKDTGKRCGECRACWSKLHRNIDYPKS